MVQVNLLVLMVDRLMDVPDEGAKDIIQQEGYAWFLEGDNEEYMAPDAIMVSKNEVTAFNEAAEACYELFKKGLAHVSDNNLWSRLGIPSEIIPLIKYDMIRDLPHICGRFDLSGGVDGIPIKLIEFNADTSSLMPESAYFQSWMHEPIRLDYKGQFNYLVHDLTKSFRDLKNQFEEKTATLLLCSLGYEEDRLNLNVIREAAEAAGFEVDYADLEDVVFSDEGVFLETEEGYVQYFFMYKMVPWEFMMFEEPELMELIVDLSLKDEVLVFNPAYTIAYQAKHMLTILYELFPDNPYLLPTSDEKTALQGKQHVCKVNFGRLGENISVIDSEGSVISKTHGDFAKFSKIYQEFAEMYADEDGDIYQGSLFVANGRPSCLCFRRRDDLIIDDDSEFVPHLIFE